MLESTHLSKRRRHKGSFLKKKKAKKISRGERESLKRGILTKASILNPEPLEKSFGVLEIYRELENS